MPITVAKIASNTADITLRVGEDTVTVIYYPSRVTEKTFAQLKAFASTDEATIGSGFEAFNGLLAHLIKGWDVYEDEEQSQMFPLAADRLAELPISFRIAILQAILADIRPEAIAPQMSN